MISKTRIGIILASAMVASAAVYAGIVHRHHQVVAAAVQPVVQPAPELPKPAAGTPIDTPSNLDPSDASVDPNAEAQQQADSPTDANQVADASQDVDAQTQTATVQQPVFSVVRRVSSVRPARVVRAAVAAPPIAEPDAVTPVVPAAHEVSLAILVPT